MKKIYVVACKTNPNLFGFQKKKKAKKFTKKYCIPHGHEYKIIRLETE